MPERYRVATSVAANRRWLPSLLDVWFIFGEITALSVPKVRNRQDGAQIMALVSGR